VASSFDNGVFLVATSLSSRLLILIKSVLCDFSKTELVLELLLVLNTLLSSGILDFYKYLCVYNQASKTTADAQHLSSVKLIISVTIDG
jgi:hypothetical protein